MRYLLDTNVVSDLVRHPQGRISEHIREIGEAQICTSIIVAAELRYGATKRGSPRLATQLEAVLGALDVLPFEAPADAAYALIPTRLEQIGRPSGGNDLLIAAQAVAPATPSSPTMRGSSPESTAFFARIGCGELRIDEQRLQAFGCALLIRPHQPRIGGHDEDRGEPTFDASWPCGLHGASPVTGDPTPISAGRASS